MSLGIREIAVITFQGETGFRTRLYRVLGGAVARVVRIPLLRSLAKAPAGFEWAHSFGALAGVT
jgi:hypothetical protein